MLLRYAATGSAAQVFFPTLPREALEAGEAELRNTMHGPITLVSVLFLLLAVGFGSTLLVKRFRYYSYGTIAVLVMFGVIAGLQEDKLEANLPTPRMGLEQRINAYGFMLWLVVLAIDLLRAQKEAR